MDNNILQRIRDAKLQYLCKNTRYVYKPKAKERLVSCVLAKMDINYYQIFNF